MNGTQLFVFEQGDVVAVELGLGSKTSSELKLGAQLILAFFRTNTLRMTAGTDSWVASSPPLLSLLKDTVMTERILRSASRHDPTTGSCMAHTDGASFVSIGATDGDGGATTTKEEPLDIDDFSSFKRCTFDPLLSRWTGPWSRGINSSLFVVKEEGNLT